MAHRSRLASLTGAILLSLVTTAGQAQEPTRDAFARLEAQLARLELNAGSGIDGRSLARVHRELWSLRTTLEGEDGTTSRDARRRFARLSQRFRDLTQGRATASAGIAAAGTGSISGMVTATGGTPLANVVVRVYLIDDGIQSTLTDSGGRYQMNGLAAGNYKVATDNSQGFLDELFDNVPCPLGACSLNTQGTTVIVIDGQTTSGINFSLSPGGRIAGRVTDAATGAPVAGVQVDISGDYGSTTAIADADGRFISGPGLPAGTYHAVAAGAGYVKELFDDIPCPVPSGCDVSSGTPIAVTVGAVTSGIDFALDKGGTISGRVVGADTGAGIPGVIVYILDAETGGSIESQALTDADGRYRSFDGLPTGTYWIRVFAGEAGYLDEAYDNIPCDNRCFIPLGVTAVPVTFGQDTSGIDFTLERGGVIAGRVIDGNTGQPLAGRAVEAITTTRFPFWDNFAFTDASGEYRILALGTGTYRAALDPFEEYLGEVWQEVECYGNTCFGVPGTLISVQAGLTVSGIDFTPIQGGSITGKVVDNQTNAPVPNVGISVYDSTGRFVLGRAAGADGRYAIVGLPTGSFFLLAREDSFPAKTYVDELFGGVACVGEEGCDVTQGRAVRVTVGDETSGIDFRLDKGGGIAGRVTDALTGEPLVFAQVSIYDGVTVRYLETVFTDGSGRYKSRQVLPKGQYLVTAAAEGYRQELYDDIACEGGCFGRPGTRAKITPPGITSGIDFALNPITGR